MKKKSKQYILPYTYNEAESGLGYEYVENRFGYIKPYLENVRLLLELGCGEGVLGERIKKESDCDVYGLDISLSGVNLAKKRGIIAHVSDLNERLPYQDNFFDLIFSDQVLEHVYQTDSLMSEIFRILKPGGTLITITPNLSFWLNRILFVFGVYPMFLEPSEHSKAYGAMFLKKFMQEEQAMGHIHVFNRPALEDIIRAHGFRITKVFGSPLSWNLPKALRIPYNMLDRFFALFPSLARDIVIIAMKHK